MSKIKIISNPYKQEIQYEIFKESTREWVDVGLNTPNGKLREENVRKCFLPFNAKEILEAIAHTYYLETKGPVEVIFQGTREEYNELLKVSVENEFEYKIKLSRSERFLDNGKYILNDTKEIFANIKPVIEEITKGDEEINRNLKKVSDALDDIVPICVFGNCSAGKSTFINALIGREVLPSGGDPVTAKAFKIKDFSQRDVARIKFKHWDKDIELSFEEDSYRVVKGDENDEILVELGRVLKESGAATLNQQVSAALEFINAYEKKDLPAEIGNMIELDIAFSKNGILGTSNNKFVIFDTPGSNTATNDRHIEVLKEALEGFSNGIPVWVSQYEALDTKDNEALCNSILSIDALDKRFTMIVVNKADDTNLPENGFSEKQIKKIMEFKSVEKMYASGIFFVSAIMGLGAKNNGALSDNHYRRIYRQQRMPFSDPDDEYYMTLYQYNIMPSQIKKAVIADSAYESNIIYVNSGLHCIETEIEEFASKYSAYNKCQMVYALLNDVVDKTTDTIIAKVENRKVLRAHYTEDLNAKKKQLLETIDNKRKELTEVFCGEACNSISTYVDSNLSYDYPLDKLEELNESYAKKIDEQYNVGDKKKVFDEAKGKMFSNLKGRVKDFSVSDLKGSIAGFVEDTKKGVGTIYGSKKELDATQKDASSETADEVLKEVNETYNASITEARTEINHIACNYWKENSKKLKDELIRIVTSSDALTEKQKENLSELIFNYEEVSYDGNAGSIFVKPKFLHGHLLGIDLFMFEKLNTSKLAKAYNRLVAKELEKIIGAMNENYENSYKTWQEELRSLIADNMVELNPRLRILNEKIQAETEGIDCLETSQQKIKNALSEINSLISFKTT
ncbi:MAG: dynamin family protein [Acutalibacteraceae bacterium]|nr:dynamin family protein [Acutalibacteraceae bacterium]